MISQTSEYGLRALVYLAQRDGQPAAAQTISEATRVPLGYLHKILRLLRKRGILVAQRGLGGGFSLARDAAAISVLDVLRATESGVPRIDGCPLGIPGHVNLCPLHRLLDEQMAAAERAFAETSIADLVQSGGVAAPLCSPAPINVRSLNGGLRQSRAQEK